MSASDHTSKSVRESGNECFRLGKSATDRLLKRQHFQEALTYYQRAVDLARDPEDLLSGLKNQGVASYHLFLAGENPKDSLEHLVDSSVAFARALTEDTLAEEAAWTDDISIKLTEILEFFFRMMTDHIDQKKDRNPLIERLYKGCASAGPSFAKLIVNGWLQNLDKLIIDEIERVAPKNIIRWIGESYTPMMHYERLQKLYPTDYSYWANRFQKLTCLGDGLSNFLKAEEMWNRLDSQTTTNDLDVLEVVDSYKAAISLLKKAGDLETQAVCFSRVGILYHKRLSDHDTAFKYLTQMVTLVASQTTKNVTEKPWYKAAIKIMGEISENRSRLARERLNRILVKFKNEFEELRKLFPQQIQKEKIGGFEFLAKNFAPLGAIPKYPNDLDYKKKVQKWIFVYHPDKNVNANLERKTIFEEVTKVLNAHMSTR